MIQVAYEREAHRLTAKGHAQSAAKGQDLICAAVSILLFTLAQSIYDLNEKGLLTEHVVKLEPGDAELSCNGEYKRCYKMMFDTVCNGFRLLAEDYPDNVIFLEVEG